ncbi:pilus assembly protein TadG-related protein [Pseudomonas lundensis]|uniref:Putative Flp pilus-assembly TadG-like N-terminal domain-containing protein n=1 Tax=Pseudomonas lundensis TaxID=86185 RepID=A0AAX2HFF2_9PSED|nr:pilus assembly protein TadG-related protein [Pseudomonas lundensis]NNA15413.1 hypothetical protein [Pseudomonas lundensis]SOB55456.1 conserved hypothetical protein [Pseudomonas lundensis]
MSPPLRGPRLCTLRSQRGAIGLMAALTLGVVLLFMLLVVDSGRLYLEQRKLQRVADVAVLEAVSRGGNCLATGTTTASTYAIASATRNSFTPGSTQTLSATCGTLVTGSDKLRTFSADASKSDAIRVIATTVVPTSVAGGLWNLFSNGTFGFNTQLTASAVGATGGAPLAALTIRSSLADINSSNSPLLNSLVGGLLGGKLNLSLASWQGLANTNINLLSYLDQLAIDLNLNAGDYAQLLNTNVSATQLINAAINVLQKGGPGATVAVQALTTIKLIAANTQILKLGDLLKLQNGTSSAGLNTNLTVFDLLQGIVQLSNGKSAVAADITSTIALVGTVTVSIKVIEPPQMSVIGNPALAIKDPVFGANRIYVKTAQVQTHIHIDLAVLKLVSQIVSALTQLLSPLTDIVNKLLNLDLIGVLQCVLACERTSLSIASSLDIYLEAASANSYVTAYNCSSQATKSLTTQTSTAAAKLSIGSPPANGAFPSSIEINKLNYLAVDPVKLISIDVTKCSVILLCGPLQVGKGGGLGLKVQTQIAANSQPQTWSAPLLPEVNNPPVYQKPLNSNASIIKSLGDSLADNMVVTYTPQTGSVANDALTGVAGLINQVTGILSTALSGLLSNLLDPILNTLLGALGVSLGNAEVGANLSCNQGGRAQLVL